MKKTREFIGNINVYRLAIIVLCLFAIIGLYMPYTKSIGDENDYLTSNPNDYFSKEINFTNEDVVTISIVENLKIYNYAINNSEGDDWVYGTAMLNIIITVVLIISIVALLFATLFKKYILIIVFDVIMAISSLIMNLDIVSRGIIPSDSYTYGIAYYLFLTFSIIILVLNVLRKTTIHKVSLESNLDSIIAIISKKKIKDKKQVKFEFNKKTAVTFVMIIVVLIFLIVLLVSNVDNAFKNNGTNSNQNNSSIDKGNSLIELKSKAEADGKKFADGLKTDYEELKIKTNTIAKYKENKNEIKAFYEKIVDRTENFCDSAKKYSIEYSEIILNSGKGSDIMYNDLEKIYDDIYDGILEVVYDDIYESLLEDMYKQYYDGILEGAYESLPYSEYSELTSYEYSNYSDAASDVYNVYSNTRSEIYELYSQLRSELYSNEADSAKERLNVFIEEMENN